MCKLYWRTVRRTYPLLPLAIAFWQMATSPLDRGSAQLRFWQLYSRINFANWIAIAMELIQPEF